MDWGWGKQSQGKLGDLTILVGANDRNDFGRRVKVAGDHLRGRSEEGGRDGYSLEQNKLICKMRNSGRRMAWEGVYELVSGFHDYKVCNI